MSEVRLLGHVSAEVDAKIESAVARAASLRGVAAPAVAIWQGRSVSSWMAVRDPRDAQLLNIKYGAVTKLDESELTAYVTRELCLPPRTPEFSSRRAARHGGVAVCGLYGGALVTIPVSLVAIGAHVITSYAVGTAVVGALLLAQAGRLLRRMAKETRGIEFGADAEAVRLTGDPESLATAIQKEPAMPIEMFGPLQRWAIPICGYPSRAERVRAVRQMPAGTVG